jgi:hypothetical protein
VKQHGIGFPQRLDQVVHDVLRELDARVAPIEGPHNMFRSTAVIASNAD